MQLAQHENTTAAKIISSRPTGKPKPTEYSLARWVSLKKKGGPLWKLHREVRTSHATTK